MKSFVIGVGVGVAASVAVRRLFPVLFPDHCSESSTCTSSTCTTPPARRADEDDVDELRERIRTLEAELSTLRNRPVDLYVVCICFHR
jgi:hypothetical protein